MTGLASTDDRRLLPTLDRTWYTDPAIFEAEKRSIWARRWVLVGRGDDLSEPGAYLTASIAGESVIVIRKGDGSVSALLNICRHRGARILMTERGVCRGVIRCPYHAWSYGFDGALRGAPNLRDWVGDEQSQLGLQAVSVREEYGCLWVNLDPGDLTFENDIGAQVRRRLGDDKSLAAWELERLVSGKRVVYDVAANWKLLVENFMECYHCATIHPELVHVIPEFRQGAGSQSHGAGYGSPLGDGVAGFTIDGREGLAPLPLVAVADRRRYFGMTLTPSAFVNLVGDHVILHRLEPISADRTSVVCDWLFPPEVIENGAEIAASVELFDRVNQQDFDACERCQLGASSRLHAHRGVLVPLEHHLEGFYDEVRTALESEGV